MLNYVANIVSLPQMRLSPPIEVKCLENKEDKEYNSNDAKLQNFGKHCDEHAQNICNETQFDSNNSIAKFVTQS